MGMKPEEFADMVLRVSKNRRQVFESLVKTNEQSAKAEKGLGVFIEALRDGKTSNDQLADMLVQLCIVSQQQSRALQEMSQITMVYVMGKGFQTDAIQSAMKLGRTKEAIDQAFEQDIREAIF